MELDQEKGHKYISISRSTYHYARPMVAWRWIKRHPVELMRVFAQRRLPFEDASSPGLGCLARKSLLEMNIWQGMLLGEQDVQTKNPMDASIFL